MGTRLNSLFDNPKDFGNKAGARSTFMATNPTPGTGIASLATATSRSETVALLHVFNNADATDGTEPYVIHPIRLRLMATTANTSGASFRLSLYTDIINRYSSGGTTITPVETIASGEANWAAPSTKAVINFGLLTLVAASDENLVESQLVQKTVLADMDIIDVYFGDMPGTGGLDGTHLEGNGFLFPAIHIRPGASFHIADIAPSATDDAEFEFEFWYAENPHAA